MKNWRFQNKRKWAEVLAVGWVLMLVGGCERGKEESSVRAEHTFCVPEDTADFSGRNAYRHCAALCAFGPRPTGSPAYTAQLGYICRQLEVAGWRVKRDAFYPLPGQSMTNLRATYGAEDGVRPILVSCHIDTKGRGRDAILGADDGASGAAVLVELARVLARTPERARQVELTFFDGEEALGKRITEEDGLYGSRYDVARREKEDGLPACMINLDMVGGAGKTIAIPIMDTMPEMYELYRTAVRELGLPEERWTLHLGSYWDDHRPFMEAGVPTLNLIASFMGSRWWHTEHDNMKRISADSLADTGRVTLLVISLYLAGKQAHH